MVATRMAMRETSFARAAEEYALAVGGPFPCTTTWRVATKAGAILAKDKGVEAERAVAVPERGESPQQRRVAEEQPIAGRANLSSDGTMIRIRDEGYKEIKISAISAVGIYAAATAQEPSAQKNQRPQIAAGVMVADCPAIQAEPGAGPQQQPVAEPALIAASAPLSRAGAMTTPGAVARKEGTTPAIAAMNVHAVNATPKDAVQRSSDVQRAHESRVRLSRHSYVAGLWDADEFLKYQYAEGLRRGLDHAQDLSSVNDAAAWIERVTATNFPQAVQIVDWSHGSEHLHVVANEVLGEGSTNAAAWVEARKDDLWHGRVDTVIHALRDLGVADTCWPAAVSQTPGYFETNRERMRYPEFRTAGYPIGSGTVESGGQNVVKQRMCRPGRGWARTNTNGMLALLCEYHSGRFARAWASLSRPTA
jgi:hypothetical protein